MPRYLSNSSNLLRLYLYHIFSNNEDAWTPEAGQIFAELGLTPGGARRQLLESASFRALLERGGADLPLAA